MKPSIFTRILFAPRNLTQSYPARPPVILLAAPLLFFVAANFHQKKAAKPDSLPPVASPVAESPPAIGHAAIPSQSLIRELIARHEADGYSINSHDGDFSTSNGRNRFSAQWSTGEGLLKIEPFNPKQGWHFSLQGPGKVHSSEARDEKLTLQRGELEEWFINSSKGIEHGFNVAQAPPREGEDGFKVEMKLVTSLSPELSQDQRSISFYDHDGKASLHYHGLLVFDAEGRKIPATLSLGENISDASRSLAIHVKDTGATYPLVIDPVITTNSNSLRPSSISSEELFGYQVSLSGNLLAVGAPFADDRDTPEARIGEINLFTYDGASQTWNHFKRLYADTLQDTAEFGRTVDLQVNRLIVGAPGENEGRGAAYIFERDAGGLDNWGKVAKLTATDGSPGARFGDSVSIDSGIAAVGAPFEAPTSSGASYASFRNPAGSWSVPTLIEGYTPASGDLYGYTVDVSGNRIATTALIGQTEDTPDDVGVVVINKFLLNKSGAPVSSTVEYLVDPNPSSAAFFGAALDLDGDRLIIGSPRKHSSSGSVEIFRHSEASGWNWVSSLPHEDFQPGARFGSAVAMSGDTVVVGARFHDFSEFRPDSGAAYLFEKSPGAGGDWIFVERLFEKNNESNSQFGFSVALSGDALAVSAPFDNIIGFSDIGLVETYTRRSSEWRVTHAPQETNWAGSEERGKAIAIDRGRIALGIPANTNHHLSIGEVRTYRTYANDSEFARLEAILENPAYQEGERFGQSVALAGDWLLVGAPLRDVDGQENVGAAYLFRRTDNDGWEYYKELLPFDLPAGAEFGSAVALTSRWAFVGAPGSNHGYVFDRYKGGTNNWGLSTIIDESAAGGRFGSAVVAEGNYAAFSAPKRAGILAPGGDPVPGAGQVITYQSTFLAGDAIWAESHTLPSLNPDGSFGSLGATFGSSLALDNGILLIGSPGYLSKTGRAFAYSVDRMGTKNGGLLQIYDPVGGQGGDRFGASVGLGSDRLFVGAPNKSQGGAVYSYRKNRLETDYPMAASSLIVHPYGRSGDLFGTALAVSGNELAVGLPGTNTTNISAFENAGSFAVFHRQGAGWTPQGGPLGGLAAGGDQLGTAIASDGDYLIVGAPFSIVSGNAAAGSAHLYRRNPAVESGWSFVKILTADDLDPGAQFGTSVAIDGDTISIGAPGWNNQGATYVFRQHEGGIDRWGQQKRVTHGNVLNGDDFGAAVALDNDLLVIGAPGDNISSFSDVGRVYVFGRHVGGENNWGFLDDFGKILPTPFDFFGSAVDVDDGRILVGAPFSDENGSASGAGYLYERPTGIGSWQHSDTLTDSNNNANDLMGGAVSLDGELCVLGGIGDAGLGPGSGAAWIFRDNANDGVIWRFESKIQGGDYVRPENYDGLNFGSAVSLRGDEVTIGAPGFGINSTGTAFVFERNQTSFQDWGLVKQLTGPDDDLTAKMGSSVTMADGMIAVGMPEASQGLQLNTGGFFTFIDDGSVHQNWQTEHFGAASVSDDTLEESLWGATADPDRDGVENAVEAFMNTDPMSPDSWDSLCNISREANGDLVFRYRQGKETYGAEGRVTWSRDLRDWSGGENLFLDEITITQRVHRDEPDYFIMEARITADQLVDNPRLFLRLKVWIP